MSEQARHGQGPVGAWHLDPIADGDATVVGHPALVVDHQQRTSHRYQGVFSRAPQFLELARTFRQNL